MYRKKVYIKYIYYDLICNYINTLIEEKNYNKRFISINILIKVAHASILNITNFILYYAEIRTRYLLQK